MSSRFAWFVHGGGQLFPSRYKAGMGFFRCPFRKLVKFVFRGWQRLVIEIYNLNSSHASFKKGRVHHPASMDVGRKIGHDE